MRNYSTPLQINSRSEAASIAKEVLSSNTDFSKLMYGGTSAYFVCMAEMIFSEILFCIGKNFSSAKNIDAAIALTRKDSYTLQAMFCKTPGVPGALKDTAGIDGAKPLLDIAFYTVDISQRLINEIEKELKILSNTKAAEQELEQDIIIDNDLNETLDFIDSILFQAPEAEIVLPFSLTEANSLIPCDPMHGLSSILNEDRLQ